jgi:hypothetical protein
MKSLCSEIGLCIAERHVIVDVYPCMSDALLYLELVAEGRVDRLRGNPR